MLRSVEGIILKTASFGEASHIITLITKECGVVSLVAKKHNCKGMPSYSPLIKVEAEVIQSHKELWKCGSLQLIASYQRLRLDLMRLKMASFLAKFLLAVLVPHAPVEKLYTYFDDCLTLLAERDNPHTIVSAFLLKLLHEEGQLASSLFFSQEEQALCHFLVHTPFQELCEPYCSENFARKVARYITHRT